MLSLLCKDLIYSTLRIINTNKWKILSLGLIFIYIPYILSKIFFFSNSLHEVTFFSYLSLKIVIEIFFILMLYSLFNNYLITLINPITNLKGKNIITIIKLGSKTIFKTTMIFFMFMAIILPLYVMLLIPGFILTVLFIFSTHIVILENDKIISAFIKSKKMIGKKNFYLVAKPIVRLFLFFLLVSSIFLLVYFRINKYSYFYPNLYFLIYVNTFLFHFFCFFSFVFFNIFLKRLYLTVKVKNEENEMM